MMAKKKTATAAKKKTAKKTGAKKTSSTKKTKAKKSSSRTSSEAQSAHAGLLSPALLTASTGAEELEESLNDVEFDSDQPVVVAAEIVDDEDSSFQEAPEEDLETTEYSHLPATVTDGLTQYLMEVRRYPLLTREQESEIAQRYKEHGDPKDAEILVTSNLRFVVKVAAEYARFGAKLIDLIQEGNVGLMHAVKEFNPYKGVRLITYAVWWIRGYIQEYLMRQYSMVRIGTTQSQRKLFYRLQKERDKIEQEGKTPTVALLSARLDVSENDVQTMTQRMGSRDVSLDQPLNDETSSSLLNFESSQEESIDEALEKLEILSLLHDRIDSLRPTLNDKEVLILDQRLLAEEPRKLQEIGDEWGVTREAVRQMEARLLKKIKKEVLEVADFAREEM